MVCGVTKMCSSYECNQGNPNPYAPRHVLLYYDQNGQACTGYCECP